MTDKKEKWKELTIKPFCDGCIRMKNEVRVINHPMSMTPREAFEYAQKCSSGNCVFDICGKDTLIPMKYIHDDVLMAKHMADYLKTTHKKNNTTFKNKTVSPKTEITPPENN